MILHHTFLVTLHPQLIILFIYSLLWYTDNFKSVPPLAQSNILQTAAWHACIVNGLTDGMLKFKPFIFFWLFLTRLCISPSVKGISLWMFFPSVHITIFHIFQQHPAMWLGPTIRNYTEIWLCFSKRRMMHQWPWWQRGECVPNWKRMSHTHKHTHTHKRRPSGR